MSKPTPGPWMPHPIQRWVVPAHDPEMPICALRYESYGVECDEIEVRANGRLIAAAPSLLGPAPNAADFLEQYANYIRTVKADDLELHPYLPAIEQTVQDLRAAIELAKTGGAA